MSFTYHTIFVVITTAFFLFRFWQKPQAYRLVLAIWAPFTMMGYLVDAAWWSYLSLFVQAAFFLAFLLLKLLARRRETERRRAASMSKKTIREELGQLDTKLPQ